MQAESGPRLKCAEDVDVDGYPPTSAADPSHAVQFQSCRGWQGTGKRLSACKKHWGPAAGGLASFLKSSSRFRRPFRCSEYVTCLCRIDPATSRAVSASVGRGACYRDQGVAFNSFKNVRQTFHTRVTKSFRRSEVLVRLGKDFDE